MLAVSSLSSWFHRYCKIFSYLQFDIWRHKEIGNDEIGTSPCRWHTDTVALTHKQALTSD
jgi:hypothetical protein